MSAPAVGPTPWYRDPLVLLVLAVWCGAYQLRLTGLTLRGEESRRARSAYEMVETGDWIVSRQQGAVFADRPPLGEWAIAASAMLCGDWTPTAVRLPATLGVLVAALWTFVFTRRFLSRLGAAASAVVLLTFGQVLQLGRLAETEGVFLGVLTTGLFGWHIAYRAGRSAWQVWIWGYFFGALAALAKGPQGGVYFGAPVVLYLLLQRDWRFLFSFGHMAGLGVFALVFGGWWAAYWHATDLATAKAVLFGLVEMRLNNVGSIWVHIATFPLMLLASLLPWSLLLVRYLDRRFWAELDPDRGPTDGSSRDGTLHEDSSRGISARDGVLFCLAAIGATIPSLWFILGTVSRHYFGMFASFAVLSGTVIDRCLQADLASSLGRGWRLFVRGFAATAAVLGLGMAIVPLFDFDWGRRLAQPWWFAAPFAVASLVAAGMLFRSLQKSSPGEATELRRFRGVVVLGMFLVAAYLGPTINVLARIAGDNAEQTAALKQKLPPGTKLVSFGQLEHLFTFYYRDAIELLPWPAPDAPPPHDLEYFAFTKAMGPPPLPFAWEEVAVVSCERNHRDVPTRAVVVGRRLPSTGTLQATESSHAIGSPAVAERPATGPLR